MMQTGDTPVESRHGLLTSLAWGLGGRVGYVLEGNLNYTAATVSWMKENVGLFENEAETEALAASANPNDRCCIVPAFTGLGAPYWDSGAAALITGITRTTGRAKLVKAGLESIAYQISDLLTLMEEDAGLAIPSIRVDGGPTANRYLMHFQSDISGCTLEIPPLQELSSIGAAYTAGLSYGLYRMDTIYDGLVYTHYSPERDISWRKEKLEGWKKAVRQALTH